MAPKNDALGHLPTNYVSRDYINFLFAYDSDKNNIKI